MDPESVHAPVPAFLFAKNENRCDCRGRNLPHMQVRLVDENPAQAELGRGTLESKINAIGWATLASCLARVQRNHAGGDLH